MTQDELFVTKRTRRTTTAEPVPSSDLNAVFGLYRSLFDQKFPNEKPNITKREGAVAKRLLREHGREKVLQRLHAFMALNDDHIRDTVGFTITGLEAKWNWLTGKLAVKQPIAKKTRRLAEATKQFLGE